MWDAAQDTVLPGPFPVCSEAPRCGDLGEQQKPSGRLPGKAALEFCDKVEGGKESSVVGNKASCSALHEGMFSVFSVPLALLRALLRVPGISQFFTLGTLNFKL